MSGKARKPSGGGNDAGEPKPEAFSGASGDDKDFVNADVSELPGELRLWEETGAALDLAEVLAKEALGRVLEATENGRLERAAVYIVLGRLSAQVYGRMLWDIQGFDAATRDRIDALWFLAATASVEDCRLAAEEEAGESTGRPRGEHRRKP